ncbi:MAG: hypothetical protein ACK56I_15810, partial [bacterium]
MPEAIQGEQPEETLLMKAIKDIKTLENRLALEKHFPILADCVRMCRWDVVPEAIIQLAKELQDCARNLLECVDSSQDVHHGELPD